MTNYTIDGNEISFVSFDWYKKQQHEREREREGEKEKNVYPKLFLDNNRKR